MRLVQIRSISWLRVLPRAAALAAVSALASTGPAPQTPGPPRIAVCFAPGTSVAYADAVNERLGLPERIGLFRAADNDGWSRTATDGGFLDRADPITLTWAVVPDGTPISGFAGEGSAPSNLRAFLDGIYGNEATWRPILESVFDRWSELTGVTYVRETADDSASLGSNSGSLGVRADIRIGGHRIDGNSGTLAYNFFPNSGDMVIDTADSFFNNTGSNSRRLRNVFSHEHGHGLGFEHVCPLDQTKLMEPFASTAFDGPQHDDIRAGQRLYGDRYEPNDTAGSGFDLGNPGEGTLTLEDAGIDGSDDDDVFAIGVASGMTLGVTLTPQGESYDEGPYFGSCGGEDEVDSLRRVNLGVEFIGRDGSTVLRSEDSAGPGGVETMTGLRPTDGPGTYYVRVSGSATDEVQLYELEVSVAVTDAQPAAVDDVDDALESTPERTDVLANDSGLEDGPVNVTIVDDPDFGSAQVNGDRSITYTPEVAFVGSDDYTYRVTDADGDVSEATVFFTVAPSPYTGSAKVDRDRDLFPDELELSLGSEVLDPASIPAIGAPTALDVTKAKLKLRFGGRATGKVTLQGYLPVAEDFDPEGAQLQVYVGGVVRTFTLNRKGKSPGKSKEKAQLKRTKRSDTERRYTVKLSRSDVPDFWVDEDLVAGEESVKDAPREITVFVILDGVAQERTLELDYTTKRGRKGVARLRTDD